MSWRFRHTQGWWEQSVRSLGRAVRRATQCRGFRSPCPHSSGRLLLPPRHKVQDWWEPEWIRCKSHPSTTRQDSRRSTHSWPFHRKSPWRRSRSPPPPPCSPLGCCSPLLNCSSSCPSDRRSPATAAFPHSTPFRSVDCSSSNLPPTPPLSHPTGSHLRPSDT